MNLHNRNRAALKYYIVACEEFEKKNPGFPIYKMGLLLISSITFQPIDSPKRS